MTIDSDSHEQSDGDGGIAVVTTLTTYVCACGNLVGLRGRCLAECALNCKCRHKQGTSRYKPGYVQIQTGYVQISTGIHSDTE